jgi:hypothetical protein
MRRLQAEAGRWARRGGDVAEHMIEANGVELCTEAFGEPTDPPILLVMGLDAVVGGGVLSASR